MTFELTLIDIEVNLVSHARKIRRTKNRSRKKLFGKFAYDWHRIATLETMGGRIKNGVTGRFPRRNPRARSRFRRATAHDHPYQQPLQHSSNKHYELLKPLFKVE